MKVLTIGGATIDTIAIIASDRIERMTMLNADNAFLLLEEGRKTEALEISTHCGGGAVNAAVAMVRLGADAAALVKLGQDSRAETILIRLMEEGVSARWALRDGRAPTGASVIISSHDRNAATFTFRGANTLLEPQDLREEAFAVDAVYVANLSNESADCFPGIVSRAKKHGAMVAANPGVRQLSARGGAFQQCLALIDVLALNRVEAGVLVPVIVAKFGEGGPALAWGPGEKPVPLATRGLAGGGFEISLMAFFDAMRKFGPKYVALTDGARGAFVGTREEIVFCPAIRGNVAGTAGAGDAFAATFTTEIAAGRSHRDAVRAATINAASVISYIDTQTGLLRRSALDQRLSEGGEHTDLRSWRY